MARRQVLRIDGIDDASNPVPPAVKVGNMVYCVRVSGKQPGTGGLASDPQQQIDQLFANIEALMNMAGGSVDDIATIVMYLRDMSHREQVNNTWLRLFPDAASRPVRNTIQREFGDGQIAGAEFTAVLG
jgi:2-iminobutanoate/2-iminopropanoate deaminase